MSESIRFPCPACGAKLSAVAAKVGASVRCPKCAGTIRVPASTVTSQLVVAPTDHLPPGEPMGPAGSEAAQVVVVYDEAPVLPSVPPQAITPPASANSRLDLDDPHYVAVPRRAIYVHALLILAVAAAFFALGWWLAP